jgi:8-oxo-dGTP diphosphatase
VGSGDHAALHSVSVAAAVVDREDHVLVVRRRDNGRWEPPGGVLELPETIDAGLRREVLEETGLTIAVEALTGVYKNLSRGIVALVFRCHPADGIPTVNDEVSEFRWLTRNEVPALLPEAYAARLTDALDYVGTPAIRQHDGTHLIPGA